MVTQMNPLDTSDTQSPTHLPNWISFTTNLQQRLNGHGGIIVLDAQGKFGIAHNTPRMAWGYKTLQKEDAGVKRES